MLPRDALADANLTEIELRRLLRRAAALVWAGIWYRSRPKGAEVWVEEKAMEFVQEAIGAALGQRTWNRERYPTFYAFVLSVLESVISNAKRSFDNRSIDTRLKDQAIRTKLEDDAYKDGYRGLEADGVSDAELRTKILNAVEGDKKLTELITAMLEDVSDRQDLAILLEEPVDGITNLKKRLKRKLIDAGLAPKTASRAKQVK